MRMRLTAAALLMSAPAAANFRDDLTALTQGLAGTSLTAAVARVGIPEKKYDMGGGAVYEWQYGPVFLGDAAGMVCRIKAIVGKDEVITRAEWTGNTGACQPWAQKLKAR
jgi:hypothetical protein